MVSDFRFLGTYSTSGKTWNTNSTLIQEKAQQRLYFLGILRKSHVFTLIHDILLLFCNKPEISQTQIITSFTLSEWQWGNYSLSGITTLARQRQSIAVSGRENTHPISVSSLNGCSHIYCCWFWPISWVKHDYLSRYFLFGFLLSKTAERVAHKLNRGC